MAHSIRDKREALRQRLIALVGSPTTALPESITAQIEELLEEVLEDDDLLAEPLPLRSDLEDEDDRIVITGIGLVTPFGVGQEPFWHGLTTGMSAVGPISQCDASPFPCQIAGEVRGLDARAFMDVKEARRMSRASQFAVAAARMALDDSGLMIDSGNRHQIGVLVGCGSSSMPDIELAARSMINKGFDRVSPLALPASLPNMPAHYVSKFFQALGPLTAPSSSSSGGNGVYAYGSSNPFPNNTFSAANYWVDVVFSPSATQTPPVLANVAASASYRAGATATTLSTALAKRSALMVVTECSISDAEARRRSPLGSSLRGWASRS